jgi:hypothetical protein
MKAGVPPQHMRGRAAQTHSSPPLADMWAAASGQIWTRTISPYVRPPGVVSRRNPGLPTGESGALDAAGNGDQAASMTLGMVFGRAARTRRGIAGLLVGSAAVGLGIYAAFAGQPAQAGDGSAPGLAITSAAAARLDAIARTVARDNGDARPSWIEAVITTHGKALESATPGDTEPSGNQATVYLITMKGHFTGYDASVPPGARLPTGTYISLVVMAKTFAVTDSGLSPHAPPVAPASLGPVRFLKV